MGPAPAEVVASDSPAVRPNTITRDSSLTAPSCPDGHVAGSEAWDMGLESSKRSSQVRQRNSYTGIPQK